MKLAVILCMLGVAVFGADAKKPASKPAAAKSKVVPLSIPAGAVKVDENTYRFTDTAGKTWLYQKTPFGLTKVEQSEAAAASAAAESGPQKATDSTPFGKTTASAQG